MMTAFRSLARKVLSNSCNDKIDERDYGADYSVRVPSPNKLISSDGRYKSGWLENFTGDFNFSDSMAVERRFQKWVHVHFETRDYFVVANVAHLGLAGNISISLYEKSTGETTKSSKTSYWIRNEIRTDENYTLFEDPVSGSFMRLEADGGVSFCVYTPGMHFEGEASCYLGEPFTQITGYPNGLGAIQWWGNLALQRGIVKCGNRVLQLEKGAKGAYDRTAGHRRMKQNWNWLSAVGMARNEKTGQETPFSLQISKDRKLAKPQVSAKKYNLWLGSELRKYSEFVVEYACNPHTKKTGEWTILGVGGNDSISLSLCPKTHRREKKSFPGLFEVDFNQYYGILSGRFVRDGEAYVVDDVFSVAEDSLMHFKI